jgi:hypothetical protein
MDHFAGPLGAARIFKAPFASAVEAISTLDEGYSEDTRSLADNDSTMGMDQDSANNIPSYPVGSPGDDFLSLSEAQKCGTWPILRGLLCRTEVA